MSFLGQSKFQSVRRSGTLTDPTQAKEENDSLPAPSLPGHHNNCDFSVCKSHQRRPVGGSRYRVVSSLSLSMHLATPLRLIRSLTPSVLTPERHADRSSFRREAPPYSELLGDTKRWRNEHTYQCVVLVCCKCLDAKPEAYQLLGPSVHQCSSPSQALSILIPKLSKNIFCLPHPK